MLNFFFLKRIYLTKLYNQMKWAILLSADTKDITHTDTHKAIKVNDIYIIIFALERKEKKLDLIPHFRFFCDAIVRNCSLDAFIRLCKRSLSKPLNWIACSVVQQHQILRCLHKKWILFRAKTHFNLSIAKIFIRCARALTLQFFSFSQRSERAKQTRVWNWGNI